MTVELRQSTATTIILGPFVDNADGATTETGLTISQADIRVSKNGAAFAQKNDTNAATHMENAQYACALNTTDTNTLGWLRVSVYESGALIWWQDYQVVTQNWWDSKYSTDRLQVHVDEMTAGIITNAVIAADAIGASELAADAVTEIQNGLATAAALQIVDDFVDELESRLSATRAGYLDNLSGGPVALASALSTVAGYIDTEVAAILAAVDTEIAAIKAKTDNLPSDPADQSAVEAAITAATSPLATAASIAALNDLSAAEVNAEVVDALATDTYAEPSSVPAATSSIKDKIGFLFAALRNTHLTTATTDTIRNDANSGNIGTSTMTEDGTTFTRGEYA